MYKVFVNERPLILTDRIVDPEQGKYFLMNKEQVPKAVEALRKNKLPKAYIYLPMGFALMIEMLQMRYEYNRRRKMA